MIFSQQQLKIEISSSHKNPTPTSPNVFLR